MKSKKKNLAIKKTPKAPTVPPTIDMAPPNHVPNRKPLIIDSNEANGKLHIIKKLYKRTKINKSNAKAAEIEDGEARIATKFAQGQMYLKSPFNGTSDWIRLHSPAPPLPHKSMANFWQDLRKEAKKSVD